MKKILAVPLQNKPFEISYVTFEIGAPYESRIKKMDATQTISAFVGSTYLHQIESTQTKQIHILDSIYTTQTPDGVVLAVADGCGHPEGDLVSLHNIARTSQFAARYSCQLLSRYARPDAIAHDYLALISELDNAIIHETLGEEQTTITAIRVFQTKGMLQCVGFSVGDTCIVAIQPNWTFLQLNPLGRIGGRTYQLGRLGGGDTQVHHIHPINTLCPIGTVFVAISDGVFENLPHCQQNDDQLDTDQLTQLFQYPATQFCAPSIRDRFLALIEAQAWPRLSQLSGLESQLKHKIDAFSDYFKTLPEEDKRQARKNFEKQTASLHDQIQQLRSSGMDDVILLAATP